MVSHERVLSVDQTVEARRVRSAVETRLMSRSRLGFTACSLRAKVPLSTGIRTVVLGVRKYVSSLRNRSCASRTDGASRATGARAQGRVCMADLPVKNGELTNGECRI